jgi:RHS repeat-associated protein
MSLTGKGYCANLGHQEDETGLVYIRARYYESATGRFISEDPARDGVNWYLYADGNPVNRVDVDGKETLAELLTTSFLTGILNALFSVITAWAKGAGVADAAINGFISGFGAGLGVAGAVIGAGLGAFLTELMGGRGPGSALTKAIVAMALSGLGLWGVFKLGQEGSWADDVLGIIDEDQLVFNLINFSAGQVSDAAMCFY